MHVEALGSGPRLVLVHGSGGNTGWPDQRELADRYTLVMPTRSGYPPNPAQDHFVGHSYGGVVALVAAPSAEMRSLTVLEPPAFGVARDHPAVRRLVAELMPLWPTDLPPGDFLRRFIKTVGAVHNAPSPLPPEMEASVRAMMVERVPWEAAIALDELAAAPFPKLVVSGAHNEAFEAVCDALQEGLGAERRVVEGTGHSIARAPGFNEALTDFLARA